MYSKLFKFSVLAVFSMAMVTPCFAELTITTQRVDSVEHKILSKEMVEKKTDLDLKYSLKNVVEKDDTAYPIVQKSKENKSGEVKIDDVVTKATGHIDGSIDQKTTPDVSEKEKDRYSMIRDKVNMSDEQIVYPDKRTFVKLSRNFMNRIQCVDHSLGAIVVPADKGLDYTVQPSDIYLQGKVDSPSSFIVEMYITCGNKVFEINGAVDSELPSQKIRLQLDKDSHAQNLREANLDVIKKAESLPYEEKIVKILKRAYQKDYMKFWIVEDRYNDVSFLIYTKKISTGISGVIVREFYADRRINQDEKIVEMIQSGLFVGENILAVGSVYSENTDSSKLYILSEEVGNEG